MFTKRSSFSMVIGFLNFGLSLDEIFFLFGFSLHTSSRRKSQRTTNESESCLRSALTLINYDNGYWLHKVIWQLGNQTRATFFLRANGGMLSKYQGFVFTLRAGRAMTSQGWAWKCKSGWCWRFCNGDVKLWFIHWKSCGLLIVRVKTVCTLLQVIVDGLTGCVDSGWL